MEDRESFLISHGVEINPGSGARSTRVGSQRHSTSDGVAPYPLFSAPSLEVEGQVPSAAARVATPGAYQYESSSREISPPYFPAPTPAGYYSPLPDSAPTPSRYSPPTPPWQPMSDLSPIPTVPSSPNPSSVPQRSEGRPNFPPPGTDLFESPDELEWRRRSAAPEPTPGSAEWRRRYPYGVASIDRQESDWNFERVVTERENLQREEQTGTSGPQVQSYVDSSRQNRQRVAAGVAVRERKAKEQGLGVWLVYCGGEELEETLPQGFSRKRKHDSKDGVLQRGRKELPPNTEGCGRLICVRGCDGLDSESDLVGSIWSDYPPPVTAVGDQDKGSGSHIFMRSGCNGCKAKAIGCKSWFVFTSLFLQAALGLTIMDCTQWKHCREENYYTM